MQDLLHSAGYRDRPGWVKYHGGYRLVVVIRQIWTRCQRLAGDAGGREAGDDAGLNSRGHEVDIGPDPL